MSKFSNHPNFLSFNTDSIYLFDLPAKNKSEPLKITLNLQNNQSFKVDCFEISPCGNFIAVCSHKNLYIFDVQKNITVTTAPVPKTATCIRFFNKVKELLVADRSGLVTFFNYAEGCQKLPLIYGHNSMLTDALITADDKYVITADRDEKIRVSNYPDVYNIESYCLGHKSFISSIGILPKCDKVLVSGSGDQLVKLWLFQTGEELCSVITGGAVRKIALGKNEDEDSLLAVQKYEVSEVLLFVIQGNLTEGFIATLISRIDTKGLVLNIIFWNNLLYYLQEDDKEPLACYPKLDDFSKGVVDYVREKCAITVSDDYGVLFKRTFDNVQDYQTKKKARLEGKM